MQSMRGVRLKQMNAAEQLNTRPLERWLGDKSACFRL